MNASEYLRALRDAYVDRYRALLREKRRDGAECTAEVWVEPNVPPGERRPPHPFCVDIMVRKEDGPEMVMLQGGLAEGSLVGTLQVKLVPAKVYSGAWEAFPVWVRCADPDWSVLRPWQQKWMDIDRSGSDDEDGLSGVVHYLGSPTAEGGGFAYQIDFGSAPAEALFELLEILAEMGVSEIELGHSDGSDLPADVQADLRQPDLGFEPLITLMGRLLAELPEVESVSRSDPEQLSVLARGDAHPRQVNLGNLHRLLQRTGVEARAKEVYRYLRGQREFMAPAAPPDLSQLRLVVKDDRFFETLDKLGPGMRPLVRRSLAADLWLVCVWDAPNGMRFVTDDEPEVYGLTHEQVLERAKDNYIDARPDVEISEHGPLLVAQTRDCYDATLLVDDAWWEQTAGRVEGELLVCVPARHVVLIGGAARATTLAELRAAALRIEAGGDHLISNTILVRRGGAWEPFQKTTPPLPTPDLPARLAPTPRPKRRWWPFG